MSYVIGITGGVGSGKSTVLDILKNKYNASIIEADKVGHLVMQKERPAYKTIVNEFGTDILDSNENIDRTKLGSIVFKDTNKLDLLNSIIHPAVKEYIIEFINECKNRNVRYIIVEAALLIEAGYRDICDVFWYIYASTDVRIDRLIKTRNYTKDKCLSIISNQLSDEEFSKNCDITIDNSFDFNNLEKEIANALKLKQK